MKLGFLKTWKVWFSRHSDGKQTSAELENLRLEQAALADAQAFSNIGSWQVDLGTGLSRWSDQMYLIAGLALPVERGLPGFKEDLLALFHPEDRHRLFEATKKAAKEQGRFSLDHRVVRPDGSIRVCISHARVLPAKNDGRTLMVGTTQDITEQSRLEQSLRDAEAKFAAFMDNSPIMAWMRNDAGVLVYANERFAELGGFTDSRIERSAPVVPPLGGVYREGAQG